MTEELPAGIYEGLVTADLRARIERARARGWLVESKALSDAAVADVLARHVHDRVREALAGVPISTADRRGVQVEIANRVLNALAPRGAGAEPSVDIEPGAALLFEVGQPVSPGMTQRSIARPGIPLRDSALLVNGHNDLQIGTQVALEIQSADRVDLLCAFVRWAGLRLIRAELQDFLLRGGKMRVIASVYTGSTEKKALDELVGLGAKVKVSYETSQTRLHAKAWLFERNSGYSTA
ncbi:MAG: hypothetical protein ACRDGQ_08870 [Candidatus Limnocylindrales bacterium]